MNGKECSSYSIVSQLIWREFFYCMSANNPFYAEMDRNPICIDIPWYDIPDQLSAFEEGKTGFPLIDAGIRQMKQEGWIHHIVRNALSMFLTRGDLWLNWEPGYQLFMNYLIDAGIYQIPNTKCQRPNTKYQMPNTKYQIPNTKYKMPNTK